VTREALEKATRRAGARRAAKDILIYGRRRQGRERERNDGDVEGAGGSAAYEPEPSPRLRSCVSASGFPTFGFPQSNALFYQKTL
jgi:hypothetical protein